MKRLILCLLSLSFLTLTSCDSSTDSPPEMIAFQTVYDGEVEVNISQESMDSIFGNITTGIGKIRSIAKAAAKNDKEFLVRTSYGFEYTVIDSIYKDSIVTYTVIDQDTTATVEVVPTDTVTSIVYEPLRVPLDRSHGGEILFGMDSTLVGAEPVSIMVSNPTYADTQMSLALYTDQMYVEQESIAYDELILLEDERYLSGFFAWYPSDSDRKRSSFSEETWRYDFQGKGYNLSVHTKHPGIQSFDLLIQLSDGSTASMTCLIDAVEDAY